MAEIKIEKKKAMWPWILIGLALLAIILYFVFFNKQPDDRAMATNTDTTEQRALPGISAVEEYITYIQNRDTGSMSLDHNFSHDALTKLADATRETANKTGYDVQRDLDSVQHYTAIITDDPMENVHADNIKLAASLLSTALQRMQMEKFPLLVAEGDAVKNAANAIDVQTLTLDQKSAVYAFYSKAADLLRKMN